MIHEKNVFKKATRESAKPIRMPIWTRGVPIAPHERATMPAVSCSGWPIYWPLAVILLTGIILSPYTLYTAIFNYLPTLAIMQLASATTSWQRWRVQCPLKEHWSRLDPCWSEVQSPVVCGEVAALPCGLSDQYDSNHFNHGGAVLLRQIFVG